MMAETVRHYYPRLVDLHNYPAANSIAQKLYNWNTLNRTTHKLDDEMFKLESNLMTLQMSKLDSDLMSHFQT
jgi:hypothetical protein